MNESHSTAEAVRHTPGPWSFMTDTTGEYLAVYAKTQGGTKVICPVKIADEGDARLIAAAPELYAALKTATEYLEEILGPCDKGCKCLLHSFHAAIAKAALVLLLLLLPSSLFAQDRPFTFAKAALVTAAAADASTTMFLLGQQPQQFREGNPILRSFANKPLIFGAVQGGTTAALLIVLHRVHRTHPTLATVLALGMASLETGLAVRTAGRVR